MGDVPSLHRAAIARLAVRMGIEWPVHVEWMDDPNDGRGGVVYHAYERQEHFVALFERPDMLRDPALRTFALLHELIHCRDYEAGRYRGHHYELYRDTIENEVSREALNFMPEVAHDPLIAS